MTNPAGEIVATSNNNLFKLFLEPFLWSLFYWVVLELWTQVFTLYRQVLYLLSHASSPFALVILEIGSHFSPRWAWTMNLLFYASHHSWDDRCIALYPPFFLL
jgi:hypothetical protein